MTAHTLDTAIPVFASRELTVSDSKWLYRVAVKLRSAPEDLLFSCNEKSLWLLVDYFTNRQKDTASRRWMGLLLAELVIAFESMRNIIGKATRDVKHRIGNVVLSPESEALRILAGAIISALHDDGEPLSAYWPEDIAKEAAHTFSQRPESQFLDSLDFFLDKVDQIGKLPEKDSQAFYPIHLLVYRSRGDYTTYEGNIVLEFGVDQITCASFSPAQNPFYIDVALAHVKNTGIKPVGKPKTPTEDICAVDLIMDPKSPLCIINAEQEKCHSVRIVFQDMPEAKSFGSAIRQKTDAITIRNKETSRITAAKVDKATSQPSQRSSQSIIPIHLPHSSSTPKPNNKLREQMKDQTGKAVSANAEDTHNGHKTVKGKKKDLSQPSKQPPPVTRNRHVSQAADQPEDFELPESPPATKTTTREKNVTEQKALKGLKSSKFSIRNQDRKRSGLKQRNSKGAKSFKSSLDDEDDNYVPGAKTSNAKRQQPRRVTKAAKVQQKPSSFESDEDSSPVGHHADDENTQLNATSKSSRSTEAKTAQPAPAAKASQRQSNRVSDANVIENPCKTSCSGPLHHPQEGLVTDSLIKKSPIVHFKTSGPTNQGTFPGTSKGRFGRQEHFPVPERQHQEGSVDELDTSSNYDEYDDFRPENTAARPKSTFVQTPKEVSLLEGAISTTQDAEDLWQQAKTLPNLRSVNTRHVLNDVIGAPLNVLMEHVTVLHADQSVVLSPRNELLTTTKLLGELAAPLGGPSAHKATCEAIKTAVKGSIKVQQALATHEPSAGMKVFIPNKFQTHLPDSPALNQTDKYFEENKRAPSTASWARASQGSRDESGTGFIKTTKPVLARPPSERTSLARIPPVSPLDSASNTQKSKTTQEQVNVRTQGSQRNTEIEASSENIRSTILQHPKTSSAPKAHDSMAGLLGHLPRGQNNMTALLAVSKEDQRAAQLKFKGARGISISQPVLDGRPMGFPQDDGQEDDEVPFQRTASEQAPGGASRYHQVQDNLTADNVRISQSLQQQDMPSAAQPNSIMINKQARSPLQGSTPKRPSSEPAPETPNPKRAKTAHIELDTTWSAVPMDNPTELKRSSPAPGHSQRRTASQLSSRVDEQGSPYPRGHELPHDDHFSKQRSDESLGSDDSTVSVNHERGSGVTYEQGHICPLPLLQPPIKVTFVKSTVEERIESGVTKLSRKVQIDEHDMRVPAIQKQKFPALESVAPRQTRIVQVTEIPKALVPVALDHAAGEDEGLQHVADVHQHSTSFQGKLSALHSQAQHSRRKIPTFGSKPSRVSWDDAEETMVEMPSGQDAEEMDLNETGKVAAETNEHFYEVSENATNDSGSDEAEYPEDVQDASADNCECLEGDESAEEEDDWERALRPHQQDLAKVICRISERLLRHIFDNEKAVASVVADYNANGQSLIADLVNFHHEAYEKNVQELGGQFQKLSRNLDDVRAMMNSGQKGMGKTLTSAYERSHARSDEYKIVAKELEQLQRAYR